MKSLTLAIALTLASLTTQAQTVAAPEAQADWQIELDNYKQSLQGYNKVTLWVHHGFYSAAALTTCTMSMAIAGATVIADTIPVTNLLSEGMGNLLDEEYISWEAIFDLETLVSIGRGALGGGVIGTAEALEFVGLWLAGEEERSFQAIKKVYASSFATIDALFAEKGQCLMNLSRVMITRDELQRRGSIHQDTEVPINEETEVEIVTP